MSFAMQHPSVIDWAFMAFLVIGSAARAHSQKQPAECPIAWRVVAGVSVAARTTARYIEDGWMLSGAQQRGPQPDGPLALQDEMHNSDYGATSKLARPGSSLWAHARGLDVNGLYRIPLARRGREYLATGIGEHYRKVRLAETVLIGLSYCGPWRGNGYAGVFSVQGIAQRISTWHFAWNVDFGVAFLLSYVVAWVVDMRHHQRMNTDTPTQFSPIRVGLRP